MYVRCMFFFNDTATTEIYTLSLHDALPIYVATIAGEKAGIIKPDSIAVLAHQPAGALEALVRRAIEVDATVAREGTEFGDRKSTRLNSSHANISYAVFCLKKKTQPMYTHTH